MKLTKLNELVDEGRVLKGSWALSPSHELSYKTRGRNEEIKLSGTLVAAGPGALLFSLTERQENQDPVTSLHKLKGVWKADLKNRLVFEAQKESGKKDVLTFHSAWTVNEKNELVYEYEETALKTKKKIRRTLVFKGAWNITEKNALSYLLSADSGSAFRFRGAFQTQSILAKDGEIRYQLGAELGGRRRRRSVTLFGRWLLSRKFGLSFEMARHKAISFGADYALSKGSRVEANLKSQIGRPLGVELILTADVFKNDGQVFARLQKSLEESRFEAGIRFRW